MTTAYDIDAEVHKATTLDEVARLSIDASALRTVRRGLRWWQLGRRWRVGGELIRTQALLEEARERAGLSFA